ncbi:MAG: TIGR02677 family protein [Longicatena sp.]
MQIYDKLVKPISEVNYLRAENVERYRVIIRYFFREHENINYWMYKEDIFKMMSEIEQFLDYTMDKCQGDLQALTEWGNLTAMQDSAKATSIVEFKNKKFRYQLSEYTVVIERMTIELENLEIEGASLEPTLLERIKKQVLQLLEIKDKEDVEVASWWRALNNDFIRLNQDYQDYIKTLNSAKAEQMMKSKEFLIFKDKLIVYLQTFVKSLQEHGWMIETFLEKVHEEDMQQIFDKVCTYELSIPRITSTITREEILATCKGRWNSLFNWFVGENGANEINRLFDITNEIIRKITRYALQIGELHNVGANRKEEYRNIAKIFKQCESLHDAHILSSYVFGVDTSLHLKNALPRETDSIYSGVYEETPTYLSLEPRTRVARKKAERIAAFDYTLEKRIQHEELMNKMEEDAKRIKALQQGGSITFALLPRLDAHTRKVLLSWLSRGLANEDKIGKTDQGEYYHIEKLDEEDCVLHSDDGDFTMPSFRLVFKEATQ